MNDIKEFFKSLFRRKVNTLHKNLFGADQHWIDEDLTSDMSCSFFTKDNDGDVAKFDYDLGNGGILGGLLREIERLTNEVAGLKDTEGVLLKSTAMLVIKSQKAEMEKEIAEIENKMKKATGSKGSTKSTKKTSKKTNSKKTK